MNLITFISLSLIFFGIIKIFKYFLNRKKKYDKIQSYRKKHASFVEKFWKSKKELDNLKKNSKEVKDKLNLYNNIVDRFKQEQRQYGGGMYGAFPMGGFMYSPYRYFTYTRYRFDDLNSYQLKIERQIIEIQKDIKTFKKDIKESNDKIQELKNLWLDKIPEFKMVVREEEINKLLSD